MTDDPSQDELLRRLEAYSRRLDEVSTTLNDTAAEIRKVASEIRTDRLGTESA